MSFLTMHNLPKTTTKRRKAVGRGNASGRGTYSGRGIKGQKARSGVSGLKLKGMRRRILTIPKLRGFKSFKEKAALVNIGQLDLAFKKGAKISPKVLFKKGLIKTPRFGVKILGNAKVKNVYTIEKCKLSMVARKRIEEVGGKIL